MNRRISKASWDRIFLHARKLWNQFDPIGVVALAKVDDEYDHYAGEAALLATKFAAEDEFQASAKKAVYQWMGLSTPIALVENFGSVLHRELIGAVTEIADRDDLFEN